MTGSSAAATGRPGKGANIGIRIAQAQGAAHFIKRGAEKLATGIR